MQGTSHANILEIRSPEIYPWSMHRHCTHCGPSGP